MSIFEKEYNGYISIANCFILASLYVISLYIWPNKHLRDDPQVIKCRFISVFLTCLISIIYIAFCFNGEKLQGYSLLEWLGIRSHGLLNALILPFLSSFVLFLGPIYLYYIEGDIKLMNCKDSVYVVHSIRNYIVAPLSEEFIFRSCFFTFLHVFYGKVPSMIIASIIFGMAHCHHAIESLLCGLPFKIVLFVSGIQLLYTTLFGLYASFIFIRTGHLISCFLVHTFCNLMGLPEFYRILYYPDSNYQLRLVFLLIFGFILWVICIIYLFDPILYKNTLYL